MSDSRFAIYYTPPYGSPWSKFGSHWIGRSAVSGDEVAQPNVPGVSPERFRALTESPRRYGFHATLKAPFHLAPSTSLEALQRSLKSFARTRAPIPLPVLRVGRVDDFIALVPGEPTERVDALAHAVVAWFDEFRDLLTPTEIERRRAKRLSPRQEALLARWGYPYVFEEYRFHMTLTGEITQESPETLAAIIAAAERNIALHGVSAPVLDAISLFEEPERGASFRLLERYGFGDQSGLPASSTSRFVTA